MVVENSTLELFGQGSEGGGGAAGMQNLKFKMEFWLGLLFSRPGQLHHTS
jgi:hypothetical protein